MVLAGQFSYCLLVSVTSIKNQGKVFLCGFSINVAQCGYIGVADYDASRRSVIEFELNDRRKIARAVRAAIFLEECCALLDARLR